jgi:NADH-quinone oxidoreductase subunit G
MAENLIKYTKSDIDFYKNKKKFFLKKLTKAGTIFFLNNKGYNFFLINDFFLNTLSSGKKKNISIIDICISLNKIIPHYCYHFNLSIAGNCRMCLVEVSSVLKPVVSCTADFQPNQKISTETFLVKRARKGIMEFLLVNHPLDCPICDQGGECDLQDQSAIYGSDRGRFFHISDVKRSVTELMCNNFIKLILTRCIHCTRCVRFLNEIAGDYTIGMLGRGADSEIGLYTNRVLTSELSSNITDFCPVGALTSKIFALKKRPWEEIYMESIDLNDSLCVPLRIDTDGKKINRVLPQYNTDLKLSWINERTRFFSDGLLVQQLEYPTIRVLSNFLITLKQRFNFNNVKNLMSISWKSIGKIILNKMKNYFGLICSYHTGDFLDLESLLYIKESGLYYSSNNIKSLTEKNTNNSDDLINEDFDSNYIFKISDFTKYKNVLLINLNLRIENPILNAKLRQKYLWENKLKIYFLGIKSNLTYKYIQIGISTKTFLSIIEGRHYLLNFFKKNLGLNLLLYNHELKNYYKTIFHRSFFCFLKKLNNLFTVIYLVKTASSIANLDLSFNRYIIKKKKLNSYGKDNLHYYIGCNKINLTNYVISKKALAHKTFIYQNSHGDNFFWFMDFFLPSYSYFEKELGYYTNCFGILRKTRKLTFLRNNFVQDDISIIKLVQKMVYDLNYNSKSYQNKTGSLRLYSYIPLHLFSKRRLNFYNILENQINYSTVYFYVYSSKYKNIYKNNILSVYSKNLNLLSHLHFSKKSNLTL